MYNSQILHEKVMREYEKLQKERANAEKKARDELYEKLPSVKNIDNQISALAVKHASRIISQNITPQEAVEAVEAEKKALLEKRRKIIEQAGTDNFENVKYNCSVCRDTGFLNEKKCSCYMDILKKVMLSEINGSRSISVDFDKDTFENFSLEWYSKTKDAKLMISAYDNMKSVLSDCKLFCFDFNTKGGNLYFYGNPGTGKTFMATCIANELVKQGKTVMYQSSYKLFQFMEDYKFSRINRDSFCAEYDSVYNSDLLIIDDLGTEFTTAYTCSVLFDILNTRLLNQKSTIISTNLNVNNLSEKYTERVSSRIIGSFELMRFMGDDIRIAKKFNRR